MSDIIKRIEKDAVNEFSKYSFPCTEDRVFAIKNFKTGAISERNKVIEEIIDELEITEAGDLKILESLKIPTINN